MTILSVHGGGHSGQRLSPASGLLAQQMRYRESAFEEQSGLPVPPPFDCLAAPLGRRLARRWPEACEGAFEFLLDENPRALARLIQHGALQPGDLTFAAEILGRTNDSNLVRGVLLPLLDHDQAVVREGAIYGLTRHLDTATRDTLTLLASNDKSEAVRSAAKDALTE